MNKLTKLNKMIWFYILILILFSIVLLYFILTHKINKNANVRLEVLKNGEFNVYSNQEISYYIKKNQTINVRFNEKFYELKIKDFNVTNGILKINFYKLPKEMKLIPNTILNGVFSYDKTTIFKQLINF
ncbi:MAG1140 family protein [Mycoplasmopsis lipophila]|uniref:MAG1140 family protein n=1 Tax=Mycoplasmopsis lipophila TaxID=2117 RepID=UPI003872F1CE